MQGHFYFIKSAIFAFLPGIDASAICCPEKHLESPFVKCPPPPRDPIVFDIQLPIRWPRSCSTGAVKNVLL